jgi:hypothetical protein
MSFCRWSSDDHQCDVYVYESEAGYVTHVAGRRYELAEPMPPGVNVRDDVSGWIARGHEVHRILDASELVDIGGPSDGQTFTDPDPSACAATLARLRDEGYRVPQYAIDALTEEDAHAAT